MNDDQISINTIITEMNTMENKKKRSNEKNIKVVRNHFFGALIVIICIPVFFKDKIQKMVEEEINKTLLADFHWANLI